MKRLLLFALAGCTTAPVDIYPAAARAVSEGQLLRALAYLDQIPPAHPKYPDARTLAQAVERRLRRSQELLVQGLELRAQWRDEEALACFEEAHAVWTAAVGVDTWIDATRNRIAIAKARTELPAVPAGDVQETVPVIVAGGTPAERVEVGSPEPPAAAPAPPSPEDQGSGPGAPIVDPAVSVGDAAGDAAVPPERAALPDLEGIERMIERGDLQAALDRLEQRIAGAPEDLEARALSVRLLHQRALIAYGRGWLDSAVEDWNRVLAIEPQHSQASDFRAAAAAELDRRAAPSASPPR